MLHMLKLGGSLITDKNTPFTCKRHLIKRLAKEIASALSEKEDLQLIIGHGSGSFGHTAASKYNTQNGVKTKQDWLGFIEVWRQARLLNQIIVEALITAGIPAISFPPSSAIVCEDKQIKSWDISPIQIALKSGLVPLVYGDVVLDNQIGGTILSTEALFFYLAAHLNPERILISGIEKGVWRDYPKRAEIIPQITPENFLQVQSSLYTSSCVDVTGGMYHKVKSMLKLVEQNPHCEITIFSGAEPNSVKKALMGESNGTTIRN